MLSSAEAVSQAWWIQHSQCRCVEGNTKMQHCSHHFAHVHIPELAPLRPCHDECHRASSGEPHNDIYHLQIDEQFCGTHLAQCSHLHRLP